MTDKMCEVCKERKATHTVKWGKKIFETITWGTKLYVCELCSIDYDDYYKQYDYPYCIEVIPEKVVFV